MNISRDRNPIFNRNINPIYNRNINPIFNRNINPIFNRNINPIFNRNINPIFNRNINPIFNRNINPIFNRNINPIFNRNINPIFNRNINPIFNANIDGFYWFDDNNNTKGFSVILDNMMLIYDINSQIILRGVKHSMKGYILFDNNNKNMGHIEENSQSGFNFFNLSNEWIAYFL